MITSDLCKNYWYIEFKLCYNNNNTDIFIFMYKII